MLDKLNNAPIAIKKTVNDNFAKLKRRLNFKGDDVIVVNSSDSGTNLKIDVRALQKKLTKNSSLIKRATITVGSTANYSNELTAYLSDDTTETTFTVYCNIIGTTTLADALPYLLAGDEILVHKEWNSTTEEYEYWSIDMYEKQIDIELILSDLGLT